MYALSVKCAHTTLSLATDPRTAAKILKVHQMIQYGTLPTSSHGVAVRYIEHYDSVEVRCFTKRMTCIGIAQEDTFGTSLSNYNRYYIVEILYGTHHVNIQ